MATQKPPKHIEKLKPYIIELAEKGQNKSSICRTLDVTVNVFSKYKEVNDWFLQGRDKLARRIADDVISASATSYNDRKLLTEKLGLFHEPFTIPKVKDPKTARNVLSLALEKFAAGEISEQTLTAINRTCLGFIESYNQTVLQADVQELKEMLTKTKGN